MPKNARYQPNPNPKTRQKAEKNAQRERYETDATLFNNQQTNVLDAAGTDESPSTCDICSLVSSIVSSVVRAAGRTAN